MKFNLKSFILGGIVGAILFSIAPIYATVQQYVLTKSQWKLVNGNGEEYADKDYPALMMNGSNYVPVGKIAQFLGVEFTVDGKSKTATFNTTLSKSLEKSNNANENMVNSIPEKINIEGLTDKKINNLPIYLKDKKEYVSISDIHYFFNKNSNIIDHNIQLDNTQHINYEIQTNFINETATLNIIKTGINLTTSNPFEYTKKIITINLTECYRNSYDLINNNVIENVRFGKVQCVTIEDYTKYIQPIINLSLKEIYDKYSS